uniref:Putative secreted protein n=1 Tax=Ixodes ricinus TaxID=34613 RepID=A0A6B0TRQ9_IXORI
MSSSRRLRSSSSFRFSSACCFFSASNLAWSSFSASLSSASLSLTRTTNICRISSSLRCNSARCSWRFCS